jgi:hypothetical protein
LYNDIIYSLNVPHIEYGTCTRAERGSDLTAGVEPSLVLAGEGVVFEVVETQPGVVACHQDLVLPGERFDATNLSTSILTVSRFHMDLSVVLQMLCFVENTTAIVRSSYC